MRKGSGQCPLSSEGSEGTCGSTKPGSKTHHQLASRTGQGFRELQTNWEGRAGGLTEINVEAEQVAKQADGEQAQQNKKHGQD